jgi:peptidoglycan/xylan/chitin deacetylase (PgdA/CDA1 family)
MAILGLKKFRSILKGILFFTVYYSGILHLLIYVQKKLRRRHCTAILFYHRFCDGSSKPYQLPHLDIHEFRRQMWHIKRWYRVITMDEMANRLDSGNHFTSPSVVITIDDGFQNNYSLAYRVLKELNLPATIYLTTGFIGTNKAPWVDALMDVLLLTEEKALRFPELLGEEAADISTPKGKRDAMIKLFSVMLQIEHQRKIVALKKLSNILGVNEVSKENANRKMLNWDEVMEMEGEGISFGAHTVTHPTLSKMDPEEAKQEIYESKMEIETRVGRKVRHFAVPNGRIEDFNDELKRYCKEIGISTVVSTVSGVVSHLSDPYFLKRINPPPPIHIFACELARYMFLR